MARLWQEAGYVSMARTAAAILGASHASVVDAILAQWSCEQPNPAPWPPVHNNPGNLTKAIGTLDATPHRIATTPPGAGLLYLYATPEAGAEAYAHYLANAARYHAAVAQARAGNGLAFIVAVCEAGYGTQVGCVRSLYATIAGAPVTAGPVSQPAAAPEWICTASVVNIRSGPGTDHSIVGAVHLGQRVAGSVVRGGPYTVGRTAESLWLDLGHGRYTAEAYYRRA